MYEGGLAGVRFLQTAFLLGFVLLFMWLVMSAPIGVRTITRTIRINGSLDKIKSALHPFGENFTWNQAVSAVEKIDAGSGTMVTTHADRSGGFIERDFSIADDGHSWRTWFTSDTSLAQDFWKHHEMGTTLSSVEEGVTDVTISETDSYRGIAFMVFRFFSLRRQALKLKIWTEQGTFQRGGLFEKPSTQFGMAILSALLLWPVFGLHFDGLILSIMLTAVVGLHELGHIIAFRMMGHKGARMVFIPILGGIAMGGRPYDRHFEIGFSALMGAGFSAFLMAFPMLFAAVARWQVDPTIVQGIIVFVLMGSLFNLGNLIPVWKFDGGQVLRQVFRSRIGLSIGSFVLLSWFFVVGFALGLPSKMLLVAGTIFALLSVMTSRGGIKPKKPLTPMTSSERFAILAAFAAVFSIHASVLLWSAESLLS
ncbi:MAG: site-2 protease family protein [Pseudomonadota bacterium]